MTFNRSAAVHCIRFDSFRVAPWVVLNQMFLGLDTCNIQHTLKCGGHNVLLIVCEFTRDHNGGGLLILEDWGLEITSIIKADSLIRPASSDVSWISIPWSIVGLKIIVIRISITYFMTLMSSQFTCNFTSLNVENFAETIGGGAEQLLTIVRIVQAPHALLIACDNI